MIRKKEKLKKRKILILFIIIIFISILSKADNPSLHSIRGYIFNNDGSQVPSGTIVRINATQTNSFKEIQTSGPPGYTGFYSTPINSLDNELVIVLSYNLTKYGKQQTNLLVNPSITNLNVTLNLTRSEPNVTILSPQSNSLYALSNTFVVNSSSSIIGSLAGENCNSTISFSNNNVLNITTGENFTKVIGTININEIKYVSWNVTAKNTGTSSISVTTICSSDTEYLENLNKFTIYNIGVQAAPTFPSLHSIRGYILNEGNSQVPSGTIVRINATQTGTFKQIPTSGPPGYSGFYATTINATDNELVIVTSFNLTKYGRQQTNLLVNPSITNLNVTLNLSRSEPNVTITYPYNDSSFSLYTNFTVTSNISIIGSLAGTDCNITIIFSNQSVINLTENGNFTNLIQSIPLNTQIETYWNVTGFNIGYSNITVNANCSSDTEKFSNLNSFTIYNNKIDKSDLTLNSTEITFSKISNIMENETVTINATIHNIGNADAYNFIVGFFDGDPDLYSEQLGNNYTVSYLGINSTTLLSINFTVTIGPHNIFVIIDQNNKITELDETNNKANNTVSTTGWQYIYGDVTNEFILQSFSNISLINWSINENATGSIFVADEDSIIDWTRLQAIGINTSNSPSDNDFSEIDNLLNMSNFMDSVYNTFTVNGNPKLYLNLTIYNNTINNIPIVNSTNTSNFITGILWDTSDSTNSEYDTLDIEDLVFVTGVNKNKQGAYGIYDYEIRIPAMLRAYKYPGESNIVLYYELN